MKRARDLLLLLLAAVALRGWDIGNPVIHVDEQYYLLVGTRLLNGAVPYLDIWDRKPIGLFLLYALFAAALGKGIVAYQLAALVAAWGTAALVYLAAGRIGVRRRGALAAGAVYLIALMLLGGRGGQSPVFYNLPMAAAGWLTLGLPALAAQGQRTRILWNGAIACLLAGIAIQMKYTPAIEGALFGIAHLWFLRRAQARWPAIAAAALFWALIGLLPSLAALGWYWAHGWLQPFWFANITSIALRAPYPPDQLAMRLLGIAAQLAPVIVSAAIAWRRRPREGVRASANLLAWGWLAAATAGFFAIGTFFDHYALPLLAPLTLVAGRCWGRSTRALVATLGLGLTILSVEALTAHDDAPGAYRTARIVAANSGTGCPYVFIGDTITYQLADTCLPTPYAFPNLLAYTTEQGATGIDEAAEVRRILASRPPVIVTSDRRMRIWNPGSLAALKATLTRDYRAVFRTRRASWHTIVFLRRDLPYRDPR
ncbi:ArnT family glycosyltransferase [Sphingomonas carotinifaciens]|uniref:Glycosyltransferase RgtA/B/C/D-like domain-containing protein n=1 Tax=Sphingomonas carotinifaciens TaxID=1166323 RepID=A0A1G7KPQ3_9SPHN|nr:hypothetical protein [Sphingomonas carotinifaciens]MBB4085357.1 4-amino-4-deoxy-L-arabinose transferase-like glycosyltransferase [Sphingomonas carotinifaciens]MWC43617.1 hypothetical protein [Sphingomonas carotinifaciens]SDF39228.1 hypothetical protein SAMN05216557_103204 [Sphingomonas carotinifaciens]